MVEGIWNDTSFMLLTSLNTNHCMCLTTSSLSVCKYCSIITIHNGFNQTESSFIVYRSLCWIWPVNCIKGKSTSFSITWILSCFYYYLIDLFIYFYDILRSSLYFFGVHRSAPDHDLYAFVTTSRLFTLHFLINIQIELYYIVAANYFEKLNNSTIN